ncbi:MAG: maleylpyruvate isomerase N-terminal domain-containing protein [Myxococcota bacterium]
MCRGATPPAASIVAGDGRHRARPRRAHRDPGAHALRLCAALPEMLRGLPDAAWSRPTVHPGRSVKDLAAHLLHGSLRRVTALRDGYRPPMPPIDSVEALTAFIQTDNAEFMLGTRRLSPAIVIDLVERYDPIVIDALAAVPPDAAGWPVAWAGDDHSPHRFDVAREYTEKWHHQMQIREAVGAAPLYATDLLGPLLQTLVRGLPFALRKYEAPVGTRVVLSTSGALSAAWTLRREASRWSLWAGDHAEADTRVTIPAEVLWKPWTLTMTPAQARPHVAVNGDADVVGPLLQFIAVMATRA